MGRNKKKAFFLHLLSDLAIEVIKGWSSLYNWLKVLTSRKT